MFPIACADRMHERQRTSSPEHPAMAVRAQCIQSILDLDPYTSVAVFKEATNNTLPAAHAFHTSKKKGAITHRNLLLLLLLLLLRSTGDVGPRPTSSVHTCMHADAHSVGSAVPTDGWMVSSTAGYTSWWLL